MDKKYIKKKRCSYCKETKSTSDFQKNRSDRDGMCCYCRKCNAIRDKRYYNKKRSVIIEKKRLYRLSNIKKHREKDRAHYQNNKEKILTKAKAYYEKNQEKIKHRQSKYYSKNRVRASKWMVEYYKRNAGAVKLYKKEYRARPDFNLKARVWFHNRRELVRNRSDKTVTPKALQELLEKQKNLCGICKIPLNTKNMQIDHIVPICVGGVHSISNIQWACVKCNITKPRKNYVRT